MGCGAWTVDEDSLLTALVQVLDLVPPHVPIIIEFKQRSEVRQCLNHVNFESTNLLTHALCLKKAISRASALTTCG
jgi:hypothetical protein